ncbi:HAD family phosphatase [Patescibacteria group bacterium]|nr:HAD family phosphatase [Patescibacteria group bacterium]
MAKIKTILFDNDGVLVHTERSIFELNREVFQSLGIDYSREDFIQHTFLTGLGSSGWLESNGYDTDVAERFTAERDRRWKEAKLSNMTETSAPEVLAELAKKYELCVVTNTRKEMFELSYKDSPIRSLLKTIIFREDYKEPKPSPDGYLAALERMNAFADQTVVVEDAPRGIDAAQKADIKVISILNPDFTELDTSKADYQIQSLTELPALLVSLSEGSE